jgi:hypothetical protein
MTSSAAASSLSEGLRLRAALPSIDTERRYQDRYLMTTIAALLPPSADLNCCRSLIGRDHAQQFAAVLHQTRLLMGGLARYLAYRTKLQTMIMHALDQVSARCVCPSRQSASLKSP